MIIPTLGALLAALWIAALVSGPLVALFSWIAYVTRSNGVDGTRPRMLFVASIVLSATLYSCSAYVYFHSDL